VLASPRQQVVEDVKGPFLLGLADSTRLLQKIFADIKEQHKLGGKAFIPSASLLSPSKGTKRHQEEKMAQNGEPEQKQTTWVPPFKQGGFKSAAGTLENLGNWSPSDK
jgi:hypothetical protein